MNNQKEMLSRLQRNFHSIEMNCESRSDTMKLDKS